MPPKPKEAPAPEPDDEPSVPVRVVDPEPGDRQDGVDLGGSGVVWLRYEGQMLRLRRPRFGELKSLRLALEDVSDAIAAEAEDAQIAAARMIEEVAAIDEDEAVDVAERVKRRRAVQRESRDFGRALTAFSERQRVGWWREVCSLLASGEGLPEDDDLPAWIVDPTLPNTVLQHWRSVPLGRG